MSQNKNVEGESTKNSKESFGVLNQVNPKTGEVPIGLAERDWRVPVDVSDDSTDIPLSGYKSKSGVLILAFVIAGGIGVWLLNPFENKPVSHDSQSAVLLPIPEKMGRGAQIIEIPNRPSPKKHEVMVKSIPSGARVVLNGITLPAPTPTLGLVSAQHPIVVSLALDGYTSPEQLQPSGTSQVNVELTKGEIPRANIGLELTVDDIRLELDGLPLGGSSAGPFEVPAGRWFSMLLSKEGHEKHRVLGRLTPTETKRVAIPMPKSVGLRTFGRLRFDVKPTGAQVSSVQADGTEKLLGTSGYQILEINHKIGEPLHFKVVADGHEPQAMVLDVSEPQTTVVLSLLERPKTFGVLKIVGSAQWQVFLNNQELDRLPVTLKKQEVGTHRLTVVDPKTRARGKFDIRVNDADLKTVKLSLTNGAFLID